jgi:hypothetical protein
MRVLAWTLLIIARFFSRVSHTEHFITIKHIPQRLTVDVEFLHDSTVGTSRQYKLSSWYYYHNRRFFILGKDQATTFLLLFFTIRRIGHLDHAKTTIVSIFHFPFRGWQ